MESDRFEALIDAILAIIITIIVMEIPLPETTSLSSLIELYPDFLAYALSFVICFEVWNYHHNLFNVVNKLNSTVTWTGSIAIMIVGLLPHVTTMIATNFYSFTAQAMFGVVLLITNLNFYLADLLLLRVDKANIALRLALNKRKKITTISFILQSIGFVLGYLLYPPIIFVACVLSVSVALCWSKIKDYI
ncbi:MAG: DUF1211 domain-containing protein [Methanosphaera sp.]|nr:DUF1211 domain-containing protein [Methanosphaera sp.]